MARSRLIKKSSLQRVIFAVAFIVLLAHCSSILLPFVWMVMSTFKGSYEFLMQPALALPESFSFRNWGAAFTALNVRGTNLFGMFFNSLWWTLGNTFCGVFMSSVVSYTLAKYKFRGSNIVYAVIVFTMVIPIFGAGAAAYKQAADLHIIDTPLLLIKSMGGYGGFNFMVLYAFFKNISWFYAESAFIDGASHFQVFFKIMLPLGRAPIASLSVLAGIAMWNDYLSPLLYLYSHPTLSTGLFVFQSDMNRAVDYPVYFAGLLMSALPVLIIFVFCQKMIMNSIAVGGIKG